MTTIHSIYPLRHGYGQVEHWDGAVCAWRPGYGVFYSYELHLGDWIVDDGRWD